MAVWIFEICFMIANVIVLLWVFVYDLRLNIFCDWLIALVLTDLAIIFEAYNLAFKELCFELHMS